MCVCIAKAFRRQAHARFRVKFLTQLIIFAQKLLRWTTQYGGIFKQRVLTDTVLVVSDPQEIARLCSREQGLPKWHNGYKDLRQVSESLLYPSAALTVQPAYEVVAAVYKSSCVCCAACSALQPSGNTRPRGLEACAQDDKRCLQPKHTQRGKLLSSVSSVPLGKLVYLPLVNCLSQALE